MNVKVWKRVFDKLKKKQRGKRGQQRRDRGGGRGLSEYVIMTSTILK